MSETVKVWLDHDEAYPVLIVLTEPSSYGTEREVPREVLERFQKAEAEMDAATDALWAYYRPEDARP